MTDLEKQWKQGVEAFLTNSKGEYQTSSKTEMVNGEMLRKRTLVSTEEKFSWYEDRNKNIKRIDHE